MRNSMVRFVLGALLLFPIWACDDDDDDDGAGGSQYDICVAGCEKTDECTGSSTDCSASCDHLRGMENPCENAAEQEAAQWDCIEGECGPNGDTVTTCFINAPQCVFPD